MGLRYQTSGGNERICTVASACLHPDFMHGIGVNVDPLRNLALLLPKELNLSSLSGGDGLSCSPPAPHAMAQGLAEAKHMSRLRRQMKTRFQLTGKLQSTDSNEQVSIS